MRLYILCEGQINFVRRKRRSIKERTGVYKEPPQGMGN